MADIKVSAITPTPPPVSKTSQIYLNVDGATGKTDLQNTGRSFITSINSSTVLTETAANTHIQVTRGASPIVVTLPTNSSAIAGQKIVIEVIGVGVGDVSLAGDNVGGVAATNWVWNSTGILMLMANGTDYTAFPGIWDSGTIVSTEFTKWVNGRMELSEFVADTTDTADTNRYGGTAGSMYYVDIAITFAIPFAAATVPFISPSVTEGEAGMSYDSTTTNTATTLRLQYKFNAGAVDGSYTAVGKWV